MAEEPSAPAKETTPVPEQNGDAATADAAPAKSPAPAPKILPIRIIVRGPYDGELQFDMKPNKKFAKMLDMYSARMGFNGPPGLRFLFDGKRVNPTDTPADVNEPCSVHM